MRPVPTAFDSPVWRHSARRAFEAQPVDAGESVDLAIVGGGIQGLSTALHAVRLGLSVRVVEAKRVGDGASGLNGGQVIPGLKYDPDWIVAHFGEARGEALVAFAASTADAVFDMIAREHLEVPSLRSGWIQAAHSEKAMAKATDRARLWQARGADAGLIGGEEIARLTGARGYKGGFFDRRAGVIDPLAFTRELARISSAAGARIAEKETAVAVKPSSGRWRLLLRSGTSVDAAKIVVATNAYSDGLIPRLARTIVPLHSFQIATAPLSEALGAAILPLGQAVSDSRRILVYYRKTADGRLMLGGRGRMSPPKGAADWAHLERAMLRLYPALGGVPIEKRWFGRVAVTPDHLPHIHEPEPGLIAAVGCQGRGVGLMTALGARLARYAVSGDAECLPLPLSPVRPIPLHAFRQIGVGAAIGWYRLLDRIER